MLTKRILASVAWMVTVTSALLAETCGCPQCGCNDGCVLVPMKRATCHMEPEIKPKKITVYQTKEVPVCEHRLPPFLHDDCRPKCAACPKYKTVLIKKEIECGETCKPKCVAEETIVWVAKPCRQCGHRPKHPVLHHLFSTNELEAVETGDESTDSLEMFADDKNASPTHVAKVAISPKQNESRPTVIAVGGTLEPGLIESQDSLEAFRQRFIKVSP